MDEAARALGITPAALKSMHERGEVFNVRGSSGLQFKKEEIDRVDEEHDLRPAPKPESNFALDDETDSDGSDLSFALTDAPTEVPLSLRRRT